MSDNILDRDENGYPAIGGLDKDGNVCSYHITKNNNLPVSMEDAQVDAFSRLRVSNPETRFDSQSQYGNNDLQFQIKTIGGASSSEDKDASAVDLTIGTADGDRAIRQSYDYVRYQPGKSQFVKSTFRFGTRATNTIRRVGQFDDENGVFLEQTDSGLYLVLRSKVSGTVEERRVEQADWNIDKFDGTGNSQHSLDEAKSMLFVFEYEWLSVGDVKAGFMFENKLFYAHEFENSNKLEGAYSTTANLPIRYEIINDGGTSSSSSFRTLCCAVESEGGLQEELGYPNSVTNGAIAVDGTETGVLSIRPKATFKSVTNRVLVIPQNVNVFSATESVVVKVYYNPTTTGGTWNDADTDTSSVEYSTDASISGGTLVKSFFISASSQGSNISSSSTTSDIGSKLPFALDIDGSNPRGYTITAQRITGSGSTDLYASFNWLEIY